MEQKCYFVNSRGLLKSCRFHSLNQNSSCNNDTNYLIQMLNSGKMIDGMSIYVCSDLLLFFIDKILSNIHNKFVLVSGDSDLTVPKEALTPQHFAILINNSYLLKWFVQNTRLNDHAKICQLPIGMDYHTISNKHDHNWKIDGEGFLPGQQELVLVEIREKMIPFHERINKIYVNFSMNNDRFEERRKAFEQIPADLMEIKQEFLKRTHNWQNISQHTFVLSPCGNGLDCHRTWEALCLGSIPIIKCGFFSQMFQDLPVLIVNEWTDITRELLDKTIEEFKNCEFNYNKLALGYWTKKF